MKKPWKTIALLGEWQRLILHVEATTAYNERKKDQRKILIDVVIFVSPKRRFYRYAASWESFDILITAGPWSPEQDIRLCRVTDPAWIKTLKEKLKKNDHRRY